MRAATCCALAVAVATTLACHKMRVVNLDQTAGQRNVSLTLSDQSVVVVYDPQIDGTKLVGFVNGIYREIHTANVKQVQVREPDGPKTAALVALGVVAFGGIAFALSGSSKEGGKDYCDAPEHYNEPICQ